MLRQATQKTPITALYARLSKDDEQQGESLSIENQKRILETFARDNGFLNCRFFVDDGWSGANFQRPGFMEMMDCVESGEVKCVITKDVVEGTGEPEIVRGETPAQAKTAGSRRTSRKHTKDKPETA